jgi:indolepyruvate decarboxylase
MTIGDFLLRRLEEAGVGHLFGVPGDFKPRAITAARRRRDAGMDRHV